MTGTTIDPGGSAAPERAGLGRLIAVVGAMGLVIGAISWRYFGAVQGMSAAAGGLLGAANLWAIAWLVPRVLNAEGGRGSWSMIVALKMVALGFLLVVLWNASLDVAFLCIGYGALPLGIVVGQLFQPPRQLTKESQENA